MTFEQNKYCHFIYYGNNRFYIFTLHVSNGGQLIGIVKNNLHSDGNYVTISPEYITTDFIIGKINDSRTAILFRDARALFFALHYLERVIESARFNKYKNGYLDQLESLACKFNRHLLIERRRFRDIKVGDTLFYSNFKNNELEGGSCTVITIICKTSKNVQFVCDGELSSNVITLGTNSEIAQYTIGGNNYYIALAPTILVERLYQNYYEIRKQIQYDRRSNIKYKTDLVKAFKTFENGLSKPLFDVGDAIMLFGILFFIFLLLMVPFAKSIAFITALGISGGMSGAIVLVLTVLMYNKKNIQYYKYSD